MEVTSADELVDLVCTTGNEEARRKHADTLRASITSMRKTIDSLEGQLKDFYAAQEDHKGLTLDDYQRMVVSLNEQVKSYIDDRISA